MYLVGALKEDCFRGIDQACSMPEKKVVGVLRGEGVRNTSRRDIHNRVEAGERGSRLKCRKLSTTLNVEAYRPS